MEIFKDIVRPLLKHLDLIIPTALTIYGWYFVYIEGNRLAKRNETFNLFQLARKITEDISKESEKIWANTQNRLSETDESKLTTLCAEFEICLNQLHKFYCSTAIGSREIVKLRRALTCSPYPLNNREATNQQRIKEIQSQISDISCILIESTYGNLNKRNN
jgi:hypothetical protein